MSKNALFALAAAGLLSFSLITPVFAESIPAEEIQQLSNNRAPDVDPGASMGADQSIVKQEERQIDNSTGPNVPSHTEADRQTIPQMEQQGLE